MSLLAHVDMDSFYVAVERRRDPSLIGKPVAVGGRPPRGVIASASYEAREFGVRSAMPTGQALERCPELVIVPPDGSRYSARSKEVFGVLRRIAPIVEAVSIDEAYLDLSGTAKLYGTPEETGHMIRREILDATDGLSASVGLGSVRHVAKMASKRAKPAGVFWVPEGTEAAFLAPHDIRALPGLGPSAEGKLRPMGIHTLGDLATRDPELLGRELGPWAREAVLRARGLGSARLEPDDEVKSIGKETTFERDTVDPAELEATLLHLCERVGPRLRRHGLRARTVTLKLRDRDFRTWTRAASGMHTADEGEIFARARELLRKELDGKRIPIRLIGVTCSHLSEGEERVQGELFGATPQAVRSERSEKLNRALDSVRERFGFGALRRARTLDRSESREGALTGKGAVRSGLPAGFRGALREGDEDE